MKKIIVTAICLISLIMNQNSIAAGALKINYTISFPEAQAHYTDVEMNIAGLTGETVDLKIPVWTPGSYLVREFAKSVESFSAQAASGSALAARKTNKNTWQITLKGSTAVKVKYRVYCFEMSVRTSYVTLQHAFISTSGMFLYPAGHLDAPSTIKIKPYKDWTTVSTSLDQVGADQFVRTAPNYDILFDSPIEIGTQDVITFEAGSTKYEVAMCLTGNYDRERIKKDLPVLVAKEVEIFGENPNKRYVFIVHNLLKGSGGLEHLSSTVLGVARDSYGTEPGYLGFLRLAAHEHFHLWNVKRLRPYVLGPFNYEEENYTTNLWIAEGFTNYYDDRVVYRMGLYKPEIYLSSLAGDINLIENAAGNKVQSLAEASFDAWIKYYRPNENSANTTVSYYSKGTVIAFLLDLEIIRQSKGKHTLDDVMKYMYTEFYKNKKRGYTDEEFKAGLEKFVGFKLDDFYKKYINGLDAIDYKKYLGYAGYRLLDDLAESKAPSLSVTLQPIKTKVILASVLRGGAAWDDGLSAGDEITAIDGAPVTDLVAALADKKIGDKIMVSITRDGLPYILPVTLQKGPQVKYRIESVENPSEQQLFVRNIWLKQ